MLSAELDTGVDRLMEHDRVLEKVRGRDVGLTAGYPVSQARFRNDPLGRDLGTGVHVEDARLERIPGPAEMDRREPVPGLRDGPYVHELDRIRVGLGLDRLHDMLGGADVDLPGGFRIVVCSRCDKGRGVKDDVGLGHALEDIPVLA